MTADIHQMPAAKKPQRVTVQTDADMEPQVYEHITAGDFGDEWLTLKVGVATRAMVRVDGIVWICWEDE